MTSNPAQHAARSVTPAVRQRLQQVFEHANKCLEKGDYSYAHDLYSQCVAEDPASLVYLQHFRANLAQLHAPGAKRSSGFSLPGFSGGRSGFLKHAGKGDWVAAFTAACTHLKKHPADTGTLAEAAGGCGELGLRETELYWLKWALDLAPNEAGLLRSAAQVLEATAQFDQAIHCWLRIQQQKPQDEEAAKAISRLSVEKTIDRGGYNTALLSGEAADVPEPPRGGHVADLAQDQGDESTAQAATQSEPKLSESALRKAINERPEDPAPYQALADLYVNQRRLSDAERLYRKALAVGGATDISLLEKLEDVHLMDKRDRVQVAQRRAQEQPTDEAQQLVAKTQAEANQAEVEVYAARVARTPGDPRLSYELGLRLKRIGKYREAIEPLQTARADKERLAEVQLLLGESFQQIGQHQLAGRSYEASIEACAAGEWGELRKLATYRAGVLYLGMKDLDRAEHHFTELAAADFGYRDVGDRLDKIARIRNAT